MGKHRPEQSLEQQWEGMKSGKDDCLYYALTLTANSMGEIHWSLQSSFVGWHDRERGWELRGPRLLTKDFAELWKGIRQPFVFVHSDKDLFIFLHLGGNALIKKEVAEALLADLLKPTAVAPHGPAGFKDLDVIEPSALNRAPSPKVRMQVLNRDNRQCKICGRRPDDHVDLEIHVHHIRPWGKHGLSEPENLITLCSTCHSGLDPHEDLSLFNCIPEFANFLNTDANRDELMEGITWYRKIASTVHDDSPKKDWPRRRRLNKPKRSGPDEVDRAD